MILSGNIYPWKIFMEKKLTEFPLVDSTPVMGRVKDVLLRIGKTLHR